MKKCTSCKCEKTLDSFANNKNAKDGLQWECRSCRKEKYPYSAEKNKENYEARKKAGYYKSPEHIARMRAGRLKRYYGLTELEYNQTLEAQGSSCKTCSRTALEEEKPFHVDHDHACCPGLVTCGKCIRGLLCSRCNMTLGLIKDNSETLQKMIDYLNTTNKGI